MGWEVPDPSPFPCSSGGIPLVGNRVYAKSWPRGVEMLNEQIHPNLRSLEVVLLVAVGATPWADPNLADNSFKIIVGERMHWFPN